MCCKGLSNVVLSLLLLSSRSKSSVVHHMAFFGDKSFLSFALFARVPCDLGFEDDN